MKKLALFLLLAALPLMAADNPSNIYAAGLSFNPASSPRVAGTGLYAHLMSDGSGTYAFTALDVVPTSSTLQVTTNVSAGVAQKLATIANIPFYAPVAAGLSVNGPSLGFQWSGGVLGSVKIKGSWHALIGARFQNSAVSGGSGYQLLPSVLFSWGQ